MIYFLFTAALLMMALIGLVQLVRFKPGHKDGRGNEITKRRLVFGVLFFTVAGIVVFLLGKAAGH